MAVSDNIEELEKVEKILGKPIFISFTEDSLKMRRNLLIVGSVSLVYKINCLVISKDATFLGIKFEKLNNAIVDQALFWLLIYLLIHFVWNGISQLQEWRNRITGTLLAHQTGASWASKEGDYPDDPRQSSLYTWWNSQAKRIGNIGKFASDIKSNLDNIEDEIKKLPESIDKDNLLSTFSKQMMDINSQIVTLSGRVETVNQTLASARIPASLKRYDRWFSLFQWNQIIKWIVIEFGAPVVIGILSLVLLY